MSFLRHLGLPILLVFATPGLALAGMPSIELSDIATMRLQTISFFGMGLLLSALFVKLIWNSLSKDFTFLPRLTYAKSLGVVALWSLLFILVLTMISGARELMTPGAWEKQGATYRLVQQYQGAEPDDSEGLRHQQLSLLRVVLWEYAQEHQGQFPPDVASGEIPSERWHVPGSTKQRYLYVMGRAADQGRRPLAYEPDLGADRRLVLYTNGEIAPLSLDQLLKALAEE